jgi:hypothetical protein
MAAILAVLSTLTGIGATLVMEVMLIACAPNTKPAEAAQIKALMLGMAAAGVIGFAGAIWGFWVGRHWLSAGLGILPLVVAIVMIIVLLAVQK